MRLRDATELLSLAAVWGGSFLFMRMGAGEFGPVALAAVRVSGASLLLVPLLGLRGQAGELRRHWRPIFVVGVVNSALPFLCFSYAALSITAGLSSIFNATAPLFGAIVAWWWLNDRLTPLRILGLAIGFAGVLALAWSNVNGAAGFKPGGSGWAIVACLVGSTLYGVAANYTKRKLAGVAPLAVATGSQLAASLFLAIPAALFWPAVMPSPKAWLALAALAIACTGLAYLLYFRLIAHIGPASAIAVTYLVPPFAVLWGGVFLGEAITLAMAAGCAVILLGTGLATGMLGTRRTQVHGSTSHA
jgi:drug/metabolite transporter (DMT)-like permease